MVSTVYLSKTDGQFCTDSELKRFKHFNCLVSRMDACWLTLGLAGVVLCLLYTWITRGHDHWAKRGVPHVQPVPFFGTMMPMVFKTKSFVNYFEEIYLKHKEHKLVGMYEFNTPTMMITDPEIVRDITVKHFDYFPNRRVIVGQLTDPLFARSLPSLQDAEWREMRNRLSPAFTTSKLKAMYPFIQQCGEQFANFLATRPDAETSPLEFKGAFTRLTNDVIATVAFGVETKAISNPKEPFYKFALDMTNFNGLRMLIVLGYMLVPKVMTFLRIPFIPSYVTGYFKKIIKDTMEHREQNKISRPDMLQLLMAAQKGGIERAHGDEQDVGTVGEDEQAADLHKKHLTSVKGDSNLISDEDITAQAFIFFFAGFETVATMMSFMAHELAVNPDVQEKLRDEIDATMVETEGKLTYECIQGMKYLDMVVSESLRKYPPAGITDRKCMKTFKVPGTDVVIEEGTVVNIPIYPLQNDPEYFPNPEKFDPERFSEENKKNIKPYTYLPFGSGPHNCIGMRLALLEVKLSTCYMLATNELRVCTKTQIPLRLSKKSFQMTSDAGFWLSAIPRENPSIKLKC